MLDIKIDGRKLHGLISKLESAAETLEMDAISGSFDDSAKAEAQKGADGVNEVLGMLYVARKGKK